MHAVVYYGGSFGYSLHCFNCLIYSVNFFLAVSWLFWSDQGSHQIERSLLDGSSREVFIGSDSNSLPNQMTVVRR